MPYRTNSDLPESVRSKLSDDQQAAFRSAFNAALGDKGDEATAFRVAWAAARKARGGSDPEPVMPPEPKKPKLLHGVPREMVRGDDPRMASLRRAQEQYDRAMEQWEKDFQRFEREHSEWSRRQRESTRKVRIEKTDDDRRLVFGWLYVSKDVHGRVVVDHSGETIETNELENAAYNFVLKSRVAGNNHQRIGVGRLVECVAFTPEKRQAMGIPDGVVPDGMWVGFKIDDDETWAAIKSGRLSMLSLGGKAKRHRIGDT